MNPELDLKLERTIAAGPDLVWRAWTEPDLLCQWFCPKPWYVSEAVIDPQPGGRFYTEMCGPDGERFANEGCFLAVEPKRRLVWTDALQMGYRPNASTFMTAEIKLAPVEAGCRYTAIVQHADVEARKKHEEMGFEPGWGTAAKQMEELLQVLK